MGISWSNLPERRRAGSSESGRLVAPRTIIGLAVESRVEEVDAEAVESGEDEVWLEKEMSSMQVRN